MKNLTREQMKNVYGGNDAPGAPAEGLPNENGGGYMCCWTGTTNCSVCVPGAYPSCVTGASAVSC